MGYSPGYQVLEPTPTTLKRYGLSLEEWRAILVRQNGCCFVCKQIPKKGRLCIDHEHVKKWKQMPPEQRKIYVRGLLCFRCNTTYVGRAVTIERSQNTTQYLIEYEERKKRCLNSQSLRNSYTYRSTAVGLKRRVAGKGRGKRQRTAT